MTLASTPAPDSAADADPVADPDVAEAYPVDGDDVLEPGFVISRVTLTVISESDREVLGEAVRAFCADDPDHIAAGSCEVGWASSVSFRIWPASRDYVGSELTLRELREAEQALHEAGVPFTVDAALAFLASLRG